eukprot:PhM_4_TR8762/c0_g2_i3/m.37041
MSVRLRCLEYTTTGVSRSTDDTPPWPPRCTCPWSDVMIRIVGSALSSMAAMIFFRASVLLAMALRYVSRLFHFVSMPYSWPCLSMSLKCVRKRRYAAGSLLAMRVASSAASSRSWSAGSDVSQSYSGQPGGLCEASMVPSPISGGTAANTSWRHHGVPVMPRPTSYFIACVNMLSNFVSPFMRLPVTPWFSGGAPVRIDIQFGTLKLGSCARALNFMECFLKSSVAKKSPMALMPGRVMSSRSASITMMCTLYDTWLTFGKYCLTRLASLYLSSSSGVKMGSWKVKILANSYPTLTIKRILKTV